MYMPPFGNIFPDDSSILKDKHQIHITSLHCFSDLEGALARVVVEVVPVLHAPLAAHELHEDEPMQYILLSSSLVICR